MWATNSYGQQTFVPQWLILWLGTFVFYVHLRQWQEVAAYIYSIHKNKKKFFFNEGQCQNANMFTSKPQPALCVSWPLPRFGHMRVLSPSHWEAQMPNIAVRLKLVTTRHRMHQYSSSLTSPSCDPSEEKRAEGCARGTGTNQCLKGLPLNMDEKYTEMCHLWSGKSALKTQRAASYLNKSNWSNSLGVKRGGEVRARKWHNLFFLFVWRTFAAGEERKKLCYADQSGFLLRVQK